MAKENICPLCKREQKSHCESGEMWYDDGSSRVCPNWNKRLDEYGGMTPEEADEQERFESLFR